MPKENSDNRHLVRRIEEARDALDETLKLLKRGGASSKVGKALPRVPPTSTGPLDYTMPTRAFVKKQ